MLIYFLKFIHVILALGILGSVISCLAWVVFSKSMPYASLIRFSQIILLLCLLALISGTLLIYPKHFTFHTHWIEAAYLLLGIFSLGIVWLKKRAREKLPGVLNRTNKLLWIVSYLIFLLLVLFIVHDAVTKSTFLF